MTTRNIGDRVIYRNPEGRGGAFGWHDEIAVIDGLNKNGTVHLMFENQGVVDGSATLDRLHDLIDWTKPIELDDGTPLILTTVAAGEHHVHVRLAWASYTHSAFPIGKSKGNAKRSTGLVISNHKFHVRNRVMTLPNFKIGDRVEYTTDGKRSGWHGAHGTINHISLSCAEVGVDWDHEVDGVTQGRCIPIDTVRLIPKIDTAKPMEVYFSEGDQCLVTFVTMTSEGHILVSLRDPEVRGWVIFNTEGQFLRSESGKGSGAILRNRVERFVGYQCLAQVTKAYIMASVYNTEAEARRLGKKVVRVTSENGKVISVELLS